MPDTWQCAGTLEDKELSQPKGQQHLLGDLAAEGGPGAGGASGEWSNPRNCC